ncbi:hypothetical protein KIPB_011575, partial [Kipferlia bialata]|eukprot:g11575.t1
MFETSLNVMKTRFTSSTMTRGFNVIVRNPFATLLSFFTVALCASLVGTLVLLLWPGSGVIYLTDSIAIPYAAIILGVFLAPFIGMYQFSLYNQILTGMTGNIWEYVLPYFGCYTKLLALYALLAL